MEVIPAIDLKGGACVQLVGGDVHQEKVHVDDPVEQARRFADQGARWIHLVDLDRALGSGSNLQLIRRIIQEVPQARFQVGGGIRFTEDIDDLLNAGAARVVIGTRAVTDEKWSSHVAERYRGRLAVAVDARGDDILIHGWKEVSGKKLLPFAQQAANDWGYASLLYTDVGREGRLGGPNVDTVRALAKSVKAPVVASGGIRNLDDCKALHEAGAWGGVVGMAAYTGGIDLPEAYRHFRG
jgi:phosphoribosylformimino-5-aminoimidazole carboxamide ribotide isomerase